MRVSVMCSSYGNRGDWETQYHLFQIDFNFNQFQFALISIGNFGLKILICSYFLTIAILDQPGRLFNV